MCYLNIEKKRNTVKLRISPVFKLNRLYKYQSFHFQFIDRQITSLSLYPVISHNFSPQWYGLWPVSRWSVRLYSILTLTFCRQRIMQCFDLIWFQFLCLRNQISFIFKLTISCENYFTCNGNQFIITIYRTIVYYRH